MQSSIHAGRPTGGPVECLIRVGTDYDTAHSVEKRQELRTYGLMPPKVESFETQTQRCMQILDKKPTSLEKFLYLSQLRFSNVNLFYRILSSNITKITPLIYTPTVGEACQKWSEIYTNPEGMYISYSDKGRIASILKNWTNPVEITVLTDGSRILGLGDLGINGMGIPVGKLALYTACAGIRPDRTLPLTVDLGTSNKQLLEDPLYMGSKTPKVSPEQEAEFLDELMAALNERWPRIVVQYEDWKYPFESLKRYREKYTMFNDDIQGTGAVILGGFINAMKRSQVPSQDQRVVVLGCGSAGVGVAKQIVHHMVQEGLTEDQARRKFWFLDSLGLVTNDRGDKLAEHKIFFSRDDNNGIQYKTLEEVVDFVKPTTLMGLSTIKDAFTPSILKKMGEMNKYPIIMPLSNPSSKSECTFEEAVKHTEGRCIFAAGSPFPPTKDSHGRTLYPGQGNNMYVFPGIGLGTILCKASKVTESMIYASAISVSQSLTEAESERHLLYPEISRIREVSAEVAVGVIQAAQKAGVANEPRLQAMSKDELTAHLKSQMYDPFNA